MTRSLAIVAVALGLAGCGQTAPLTPAAGQSLPVRPLMARATPSVDDLLSLPPQAKPRRVDELLTRNQPRKADRFDLPPADGRAPPLEGASAVTPATNGPDNVEEPR
jgi:hypothetical protein